jgi:DNA-directed RNA polymerase specialized sigma24 family protein
VSKNQTNQAQRFIVTDPQHAAYAELLAHPRVFEFLHMKLALRDVPKAQSKELFSQTLEALWRRRLDADRPDTLERLLGLAATILEGKAIDYFRRRAVEARTIVDAPRVPSEDPDPLQRVNRSKPQDQPNYVDEIAPPRSINPEDHERVREKMEFLQAQAPKVGMTDDDVECMLAIDAGEITVQQAAAARNMEGNALKVRLHRIRQKLGKAWAKQLSISPTTLVLMILMLLMMFALATAGARRSDPPPPEQPQRTLAPHEPRGDVPMTPNLPNSYPRLKP